MASVGVKDLKNRLTHYLRRTKQGEEVVVTERGRPIAVIKPLRNGEGVVSLEARLAILAAQGRVALPTRRSARRIPTVRIAGKLLSQMVLNERR